MAMSDSVGKKEMITGAGEVKNEEARLQVFEDIDVRTMGQHCVCDCAILGHTSEDIVGVMCKTREMIVMFYVTLASLSF